VKPAGITVHSRRSEAELRLISATAGFGKTTLLPEWLVPAMHVLNNHHQMISLDRITVLGHRH
jgi:ATP/maltotriose-dependent transcriptional regulator MalT